MFTGEDATMTTAAERLSRILAAPRVTRFMPPRRPEAELIAVLHRIASQSYTRADVAAMAQAALRRVQA